MSEFVEPLSFGGRLKAVARRLIACVLPRRCAGCRRELRSGQSGFCSRCEPTVETLSGPQCPQCASPRPTAGAGADDGVDARCHRCLEAPPAHELARARWRYGGAVSDALQAVKYSGQTWRLAALVRRLGPWLAGLHRRLALRWDAPDLTFCPVPAHPRAVRRRGFYPAGMLLDLAARAHDLPVVDDLLAKPRPTRPQAGLPRAERRSNVRGAFRSPGDRADGRCWILFDDVMTTGATIGEASRTLADAGARRIGAAVAARSADRL